MSLLDFFRSRKSQSSASIAKERLQIIVAHERGNRSQPDYLPQLQKDLLEVIRKYVPIDQEQVQVELPTRAAVRSWNSTSPCRSVDPVVVDLRRLRPPQSFSSFLFAQELTCRFPRSNSSMRTPPCW